MKSRRVVVSPEAGEDLITLYNWVADCASPRVAAGYLDRVETWLRSFSLASERGTLRDDIRPGLRVAGSERRLTVAFTVEENTVTILRLYRAGRDWESEFEGG